MKSLIRLDPFRAMRRWDPFGELRDMQHERPRLCAADYSGNRDGVEGGDQAARSMMPPPTTISRS